VDVTPTQPVASPDLAHEAEGLLRSLAGVTRARVVAGDRGIEAIHVIAADRHVAPSLAGQVRSALLAGLATPILPARIHIRVDDHTDTAHHRPDHDAAPIHGLRLMGNSQPKGESRHTPAPEPEGDPGQVDPGPIGLPRLVTVDLDRRDDGRILCRVSVAFQTRVRSDEALASDLPGAAAHAAAQAAVRALIQAGIHGLELLGLREVEIAGRHYAVVALQRSDTARRIRSASAPITGSGERAAALATVMAAKELL
jgi:hypothetical protein